MNSGLAVAALMATTALSGAAAAQSLTRIATVPEGAEVTGVAATAMGELFFNAQHPGGKNELTADATPALVGYIAGMDILGYDGPDVAPPGEGARDRVHVAAGEYVVLGRAGDPIGDGQVLGGVYSAAGDLMYVANTPDFNALIPLSSSQAYLYTAWEGAGRKAMSPISRLLLERVDGRWRANLAHSEMLDLSAIGGAWVLCYGSVTPWGTPLFAEEYFFYNSALWNHPDNHDADERPGFAGGNDPTYMMPKTASQYAGGDTNPYRYGYMIEMNNAASADNVDLARHYTMGRLSHENAVVMADGRTVYLTDDDSAQYANAQYNTASGGVLFKFVADVAGDLSSGALYAARLTQDGGDNDPRVAGFDVAWIELGHADNALIESWIAQYDGIGVDAYVEGESNFISDADVMAWAEGKTGEDLNGDGEIGVYVDDRAAFLESRKAAAALGATNEWNKLEGASAGRDVVYVAASDVTNTMAAGWGVVGWNTGARDEADDGAIALAGETCGAVYAAEVGADFNITRLEPAVVGRTVGELCDADLPARPDNLLALSTGALIIGEDAGSPVRPVDMLWRMD